ncbi:MAG: hypothetical protein AAGC60_09720 [Acidobacteriota bacterium]
MIVAWLFVGSVTAAAWMILEATGSRRDASGDPAAAPGDVAARLAASGCGGLGVFWLAFWGLDALGVGWSRGVVLGLVAALLAVGAAGLTVRRRRDRTSGRPRSDDARPRPPRTPPWPHVLRWLPAMAALGVFVAATAARLDVHPDFIFHWGLKGAKHFLHGGLDLEFLRAPWNQLLHPDYPGLIPGLFAALALVEGELALDSMLAASGPFFLLLLLAADALLARLGASAPARIAGLTAIAWGALAFAIGFHQAGGADLPLAAAATLGAAALVGPRSLPRPAPQNEAARDLEIGCAALFLACTKIEGVVLGGLLVALHLARRAREPEGRRPATFTKTLARAGLLPLTAVITWALWTHHHGLFLATNSGDFDLARLSIVLPELLRAAGVRAWHGLPWLLAALPALLLWRPSRWASLLLVGQLGFYLYAYLAAPVDTALYVATSAPRLVLHVLPATLALAVAALDRLSRSYSSSSPPPVRPSFLA